MKLAVRRPLVLLSTVAVVAVLAACAPSGSETGVTSQSQIDYTPADGANANAGDVAVRNVVLISSGDGSGEVVATFVNQGASADQVVSMAVNEQQATLAPSDLVLTAGAPVLLGGPNDTSASVSGLDTESTQPGLLATVDLVFRNAPRTSLQVPVIPPAGLYEGYGSTASPTPAA